MNVLNVVHLLDAVTGGGTAERTFQLSRALVQSGVTCSILTMKIGITPERRDHLSGVDVIAVPSLSGRFPLPLINPLRLISLVRRADVVHLMNHWTAINAVVYWTCRILGKPYAVCPAGALHIFGRSAHLKRIYNWIVGRSLIRNANACIAITHNETDDFVRYGARPESIHVIPNGINPDDYPGDISSDELTDFRNRHGLGDYPVILFMGRLNPIKGPDILLDAFHKLNSEFPVHRLVFVGPDNGLLPGLRQSAVAANIADRVLFLGYLEGREKARAYRIADLAVIPSRMEAMSIVVLEAGISGIPVLATDRCGLDEFVEKGVVRATMANSQSISEALKSMLLHPAETRAAGIKLKEFVSQRFLWATQAQHHIRMFTGLCRPRLT